MFILFKLNFTLQDKSPIPNRATLVFACTGGISPPWMYMEWGARAGHSSPSESACASGQLFAVPCKTHPHLTPCPSPVWTDSPLARCFNLPKLSVLGGGRENWMLRRSFLRAWFLGLVCSPHLLYTLYHRVDDLSIYFLKSGCDFSNFLWSYVWEPVAAPMSCRGTCGFGQNFFFCQ